MSNEEPPLRGEEKLGCCKAKGETTLDLRGIVPRQGKEMLAVFCNMDYSEGVLNAILDNSATWARLSDMVVDLVDCHADEKSGIKIPVRITLKSVKCSRFQCPIYRYPAFWCRTGNS